MTDRVLKEGEIAPDKAVRESARHFAYALLETPAFQKYEAASERIGKDAAAQKAIQAFQKRQQELQENGSAAQLSPQDKAELEALRNVFMVMPLVQEYLAAQAQAVAVCQTAGDLLSEKVGLNFASSACTGGCCG
jgi:cell fate (sporulation/competence/biofilm development) regulator YlbF (YheA/YmcA/DUF963 family)